MKRGISGVQILNDLALLLITLIICFLIIKMIDDVFERTEEDAKCEGQIRAHAAIAQFTSDLKSMKVVCPSTVHHLDENDDVKAVLAEELKTCWDTWGEGKLQLFGKEEAYHCHVCSVVYSPDKTLENFPQYLDQHSIRPFGPTYGEYLQGTISGTKFTPEDIPETATVSMDSTLPLGVIYFYAKGHTNINRLKNQVLGEPQQGMIRGAGVGAVVAAGGITILSAVGAPFTGGTTVLIGAAFLGGTAGAGGGFLASLFLRADLDTVQGAVIRPMSIDEIEKLGCTYAPVANE